MPTDDEVVETASAAAEDVVFARYDVGAVEDLDVTVTFEDGVLDVDVYVNAPDSRQDEAQVADDAALAARAAVDDLFEESAPATERAVTRCSTDTANGQSWHRRLGPRSGRSRTRFGTRSAKH